MPSAPLRCLDHAPVCRNPYPDTPIGIDAVRYDSPLLLLRLQNAPADRRGAAEDADYIVAKDFAVSWRPAGQDWVQIVVPAGMLTDLTSVPRPLRWVVGRVGPWLEAAIVHDYLYIAWQDLPDRGARQADRRFADDLMYAAMRAAKVVAPMAWLIWLSVRLGGAKGFARRNLQRYADLSDLPAQKLT